MDGLEDDTFDPDDTHHSVQSLSGHGCRPFARLSQAPPGQRCAVIPRIRRWQWRDARMESGSSLSMEWPLLGRQSIEMILAFSYKSCTPFDGNKTQRAVTRDAYIVQRSHVTLTCTRVTRARATACAHAVSTDGNDRPSQRHNDNGSARSRAIKSGATQRGRLTPCAPS